ncbi:predicted protein [Chaetomium globosum CBS 148.51]|uniref:Uncharacterized protein n=1 Tax=Chaetomium globosum (strain ATCC 6205 / CBS 148.51 / DSM 1962 / NBRC 6347 / NRRL 1970) TaxID=306901 RepID=Q2GZT9_CHAGB|nr:uncharacterized protein CHGG_04957 [Chaetomium globosum CBS 148.51]EAQ88338.1 predicted protein [Chaetomium globosum CBS 148.51]
MGDVFLLLLPAPARERERIASVKEVQGRSVGQRPKVSRWETEKGLHWHNE